MNRAQRRAAERADRRMAAPAMRREIGRRTRQALDARAMAADQQLDLVIFCSSALDALAHGQATDIDVNNLAMISNLSMILCERGIGGNVLDDVIEAQCAVVEIQQRQARTGRIGASGPGLQALRDLVDIHEQQLEAAPMGEVRAAISTMRNRMAAGHVLD